MKKLANYFNSLFLNSINPKTFITVANPREYSDKISTFILLLVYEFARFIACPTGTITLIEGKYEEKAPAATNITSISKKQITVDSVILE